MGVTIYHNNSCSKSCQALAFLQNQHIDLQVVDYLNTPPSKEEIINLLHMLGISPLELIRENEAVFEPYLHKKLTDEEYIHLMVQHPILIQRPIVVNNQQAVIGRPLEQIFTVL